MPSQILHDRHTILLSGSDVASFLQNLITSNVETLGAGIMSPSALLTPQGKIAYDFLIGRHDDGFLIDIRADITDDFIKRLTLYKLRADVQILKQEHNNPTVVWDVDLSTNGVYTDLRFADDLKVQRHYFNQVASIEQSDFKALRINHGIAESGTDFELNDIFPHDIYFDINNGIDFAKGCYVGQEVVSRMKHRGTARRRVAIINAATPLPTGHVDIMTAGKSIGKTGSISGQAGLGIIRLDRYLTAKSNNQDIFIDDTRIDIKFPHWAQKVIDDYEQQLLNKDQ